MKVRNHVAVSGGLTETKPMVLEPPLVSRCYFLIVHSPDVAASLRSFIEFSHCDSCRLKPLRSSMVWTLVTVPVQLTVEKSFEGIIEIH